MPRKKAELPTELSVFSRLLWGGDRFRINETGEDAYGLICSDGTGKTKSLPWSNIAALLESGELVEEKGIFDAEGKLAPQGSPYITIAACKTSDHKTIMRRLLWVRDHVHPDWLAGEVQLTKKSLDPYIVIKHEEVEAKLREIFGEKPKKPRRGQPTGVAAPSYSALKRDHLIFRRPGFLPSEFRSKTENCVHGGKRVKPDRRAECLKVIREIHANEGRMTLAGLRQHLKAVLPEGMAAPHEDTLAKMIRDMPDGRVIGARFGLKAMVEQRGLFSEGPRYTMVGEMIYLDCWKTDIVLILKDCGAWMRLSRNVRRLLQSVLKDRVWVCVAMCMASRAILGIAFDIAETPEVTRRALRMAVSDRQMYAEMAGCKQPPVPQIGIAGIRHDSGPAFTDKDFHFAALAITGDTAIGIVNRPRYRGALERFFRTVAMQLLAYFTGRTFSNVVERGEYNSQDRASVIMEAFGNAFFRYVNDVYHLRGHGGLSGQPPIDFFGEALEETGCADIPNSDQLRIGFGIRKEATLTGEGIRYMGIQYQAKWLAPLLRDGGRKMMIFMVDPVDLGRLSVLHENAWHTIPGPLEMQGVGLTQLIRTSNQLKAKHGAQAELHWPIVAEALKDFAALGAKSKVEAQLLDTSYDSEFLDNAERAMTLRLVFRPAPSSFVAPLSITAGGLGKGFAVQGNILPIGPFGGTEAEAEPDREQDDEVYESVPDVDEVDVDSDLIDDVAVAEVEESEPDTVPTISAPQTVDIRPAVKKARRIFSNKENDDE